MVVMWDMDHPDAGQLIAQVNNSVYALCFLEESNQLLIGHNFEGIHLVDVESKKELRSAQITKSAIFDIKRIGNFGIVATGDGSVVIIDLLNLSTIAKISLSDKSARSIGINKKDNVFAVAYSDNFIRIFDLQNFSLLKEIEAHTSSVFTLTYSPDGAYLLSGGRDAHLKIWNTQEDYSLKQSIVAHMYTINHIAYSPNEKYFATCSMDKSIKVWDAKNFKLLKVIDKSRHAGHGTSVNKLLWTNHNNQLISCSDDRNISVWDIYINE